MNPFLLAASADSTTADATIWLVVVTGVLVLITGAYAVLTYRGNKTMKRSAKAAERSAKSAAGAAAAAQRSLRLAAMPLVVGYDFGTSRAIEGRGPGALVHIRNEGPTTAFNLSIAVTYPSIGLDMLAANLTLQPVWLASFRSGGDDTVTWRGEIAVADGAYSVTVEFDDPLGNRYQTARYSLPAGSSEITVSMWNPVADEWETMVDVDPDIV